jgi:predicted AlkP superfamily phosphohydrolase/phosphomutase
LDLTRDLPGIGRDASCNAEYYQELEERAYQSVDRTLKHTLELAGGETLVVLVGDHGSKPTAHKFHPAKMLVEAGLTAFKGAKGGEPVQLLRGIGAGDAQTIRGVLDRTMAEVVEQGTGRIDWTRTKAVMPGSCYIYVNLKGRDPHGIAEPGEEYEKLCEEIIQLLYDCTDPLTDKKRAAWAFRKKDARMFGLKGDRVGGIVFKLNRASVRQHGAIVTTAAYGRLSLETIFAMAGPEVKREGELRRTVWLVDVVPTICHLAEIPMPMQCEGGVLYQALTNPDSKDRELHRLRKQVKEFSAARIM